MPHTAPHKTPKEQAVILGKALARLRKRAGLSQVQAAERANIEQPTWQRYEAAANQAFLSVSVQEKCLRALGFTMDDLNREREGVENDEPFSLPPPRLAANANDAFIFPLDGTVKAGAISAAVFDPGAAMSIDLSNRLTPSTRFLRVDGMSMYPILEPGGVMSYDLNLFPKRDRLAVIRMHDGQYFIKKFKRMTDMKVECVEMEEVILGDGRSAYVERPVSFELKTVKAVYPADISVP